MSREAKLYVGAGETPVYDYTDWIDWESFELGARAYNGESAQGQAVLRDERGEIGDAEGLPGGLTARVMRGHNLFRLTEDASGATKHLVRARVADKDWTRGRQKADRAREVSPTFADHNTDLRGIIVGKDDPWVRGEETDVARVNAVLAAFCNGSPRATTVIANTYVAVGNTTTMPATDYEDRTPLDVIGECAAAAGKIFFVYLNDDGSLALWYDLPESTTLTSTLAISDRIDEVDGWTVFEPEWVVGPASREAGQNVLSGLSVRYAEGAAVYVEDTAVADDFDFWEETVYDSAAETEAQATALANAVLDVRKTEELTYSCRLMVPAERVHLIKAGMLIDVHARAIPDADDVTKSSRIGQCKYAPLNNDWYHVLLELERPKRARPLGKGDSTAIAIRKATPRPYFGTAPSPGGSPVSFNEDTVPALGRRLNYNVGAAGENYINVGVVPHQQGFDGVHGAGVQREWLRVPNDAEWVKVNTANGAASDAWVTNTSDVQVYLIAESAGAEVPPVMADTPTFVVAPGEIVNIPTDYRAFLQPGPAPLGPGTSNSLRWTDSNGRWGHGQIGAAVDYPWTVTYWSATTAGSLPSSGQAILQPRLVSMGDGVTMQFSLPDSSTYVTGSLVVYVDGIVQEITEVSATDFAFDFAPEADEEIRATWIEG